MNHLPEVVITGMGVVSPIGIGKEAFRASLQAGRSGVGPITQFATSNFPVPMGAEIKEFEAKKYVKPRKSIKIMGREIQTAFAAASIAMDDAGLSQGDYDPDRTGAVLGTETLCTTYDDLEDVYRGCMTDGEFDFERWGEQAMSNIQPLWMLKYLPNMPACHFAIAYDARGPNNSISLGDVSSLLAVIEGVEIIRRGAADVMIVGGSSSRVNPTDMMWRGDIKMSHRLDDPAGASRPFDAHRDGMVIGEGAGAFVIERREHAQRRNANILSRVVGGASAFLPPNNGYVINPVAIQRAIVQTLEKAGLTAADVGHVNAHGLSTVKDDRNEAQAIHEVLGDVPVTAPKSFFGNLGASGGAVEMAASVLSLADGQVPFTLNYTTPDPHCPVNVIHGEPLASDKRTAVLVNYSGTGQAAAVVLVAE
jgi:3-oxoacyl-[acyl-carrier-protein] synthase II